MRIPSLRDPAPPKLRAVFPALLCAASLAAHLRGDEPPRPTTGEVQLGSGRVVEYTLHFDRNSLRDSLRVGNGLIALTTSGSLLRFDLPTARLVRERIGVEEVTCLGRGEGEAVLAGLSDGRVCRVDPVTLELTDVLKVPSAPEWVGWGSAVGNRPAGAVVVTRPTRPVDRDGRHWEMPYSVVNDLATGKTFELEDEATTFLLDRAGRFWLGADNGEWGGLVWRVDLVKGTLAAIEPPPSREPDHKAFWEGLYGFIELRDGQVWAFGGTSHMGSSSGSVTRIDESRPRQLSSFGSHPEIEKAPDPRRPILPITHIVEEDGSLLIFSYSDVFRVDKALKSWKKVATLQIQYRWGRPDAVGSYPSVQVVHPPIREGGPYVLATVGDGYVLLDGAKSSPRGVPGQLGASGVDRIQNSSEGTLFSEDDELPSWRLGAKGWEVALLAPPFEIDPDNGAADLEKDAETWYDTCVLVGPGGAIYTVSGTGVSDGTRVTAHRVGGKAMRIGREVSSLDPTSSFITADGTLWNADFDGLMRFEKGRWGLVAPFPEGKGPSRPVPLETSGPPWLLLDTHEHNLWRLERGAMGENPRISPVTMQEGGKALRIDDAIRWTDGALLLATDVGLRVYAPATQKISRADLPEPERPATTIVRDGLGRLWLGGEKGLWLSEPGAKAPDALDRVPGIGRGEVVAMAPNPRHADGVIVALGSRGVAFVRTGRRP